MDIEWIVSKIEYIQQNLGSPEAQAILRPSWHFSRNSIRLRPNCRFTFHCKTKVFFCIGQWAPHLFHFRTEWEQISVRLSGSDCHSVEKSQSCFVISRSIVSVALPSERVEHPSTRLSVKDGERFTETDFFGVSRMRLGNSIRNFGLDPPPQQWP